MYCIFKVMQVIFYILLKNTKRQKVDIIVYL